MPSSKTSKQAQDKRQSLPVATLAGRRPPPAHKALLDEAYGGMEKWDWKKTLVGYSGAGVYQITVDQTDRIAKITHTITIQREYENHRQFATHPLRYKASNITSAPRISQDGQMALLEYTYAGLKNSQTLYEYLQQRKARIKQNLLHEVFQTLSEGWWSNPTTTRSFQARLYYDRFLPVNLQVDKVAVAIPGARCLNAKDPDHCTRAHLADLTMSQAVCLQGWTVEKREDDVLTVYTEPRDEPRLRIQLRGGQGQPGQLLDDTYGYIQATRRTLLADYARKAIPTFDMDAAYFQVDGQFYNNPLYYRQALLDGDPYQPKVSTIHGDLNLRNILVEETTANKGYWPFQHSIRTRQYWLIDFATTGPGPILLDFQWLETQVLLWLLIPAIQEANLGADTLVAVLTALYQGTALPWSLRQSLQMPFAVLKEIRQWAEKYLAKPQGEENRWCEYYRGLTIMLLGALKNKSLENELGPDAKQFALLGAATTLRWSGVELLPLPAPVKVEQRVNVTHALSLLLGAGLLIFLLWLFPKLPSALGITPPILPTLTPTIVTADQCIRPTANVVANRLPTPSTQYASVLQRVKERGVLLCGVEGRLPGFSEQSELNKQQSQAPMPKLAAEFYSDATGFDADFCRVVATAIFGDYQGRVAFLNLDPDKRFSAVMTGTVDVLIRNTTWTAGRDTGLQPAQTRQGIDFGPVIFHDGQKFIARQQETINRLEDLKGKKICVEPGTTTLANTIAISNQLHLALDIKTEWQGQPFANTEKLMETYAAHSDWCNVMTGDESQLVSRKARAKNEDRVVPNDAISYEPLAPAVIENDSQWRDVVSYAIWATIYAQEVGVTRANLIEKSGNRDSVYQQFLNNKQIGLNLNINPDFVRKIIEKLGNYDEIYACNLGQVMPKRGPNQPFLLYDAQNHIWYSNPAGGRLFSPPFATY